MSAAVGAPKGVLELFHRTRFGASEDWQAFLMTMSTQVAIALDNAMLVLEEPSTDRLERQLVQR